MQHVTSYRADIGSPDNLVAVYSHNSRDCRAKDRPGVKLSLPVARQEGVAVEVALVTLEYSDGTREAYTNVRLPPSIEQREAGNMRQLYKRGPVTRRDKRPMWRHVEAVRERTLAELRKQGFTVAHIYRERA